MEEQVAALGRELNRRYGSRVAVEYIDVYSPQMWDHEDIVKLLQRNVPLPIISVDGKPRFAGGISYEVVAEELHKLGLQGR